jgi:hypothetical protein
MNSRFDRKRSSDEERGKIFLKNEAKEREKIINSYP